jgi:hypothetical protein
MHADKENYTMLMSDYASKHYIGLADVQGKPIKATIKDVIMGNYDKPVLVLNTGARFSVNKTNVTTLISELGEDSRDWSGCEIELRAGQLPYQGSFHEGVVVCPLNGKDA